MGDRAATGGPSAPRPADLGRMLGQLRRGSAADARLGIIPALKELVLTPRGAPGATLNATGVVRSATFRDLATPKLRRGDLAVDFELARLDEMGGKQRQTGDTVRLSSYRQVSPVALIFGSYT